MYALSENKITFLAIDLPAHGLSEGKETNLVKISQVIKFVYGKYPSIQTIIAHSIGGAASYISLESNSNIKKIITISSPSQMDSIFDPFFELFDLSSNLIKSFLELVDLEIGRSVDSLNLVNLNIDSKIDKLIIHDKFDNLIPFQDALILKDKFDNCKIQFTEGLGHRNILKDEIVLQAIIDFIKLK